MPLDMAGDDRYSAMRYLGKIPLTLWLSVSACPLNCFAIEALPRRQAVFESDERDCPSFLKRLVLKYPVFFENLAFLRKYRDTARRACKLAEP